MRFRRRRSIDVFRTLGKMGLGREVIGIFEKEFLMSVTTGDIRWLQFCCCYETVRCSLGEGL